MTLIGLDRNRGLQRMLAVACVVPVFVLGSTSCASTGDGAGQAAGSGSESGTSEQDETENGNQDGSLDSLGSAALLDMAFAGDIAVKCDHNVDGDLIGTVYFTGPSKHRLDIVNSEGIPAHILADGGDGYAWTDDGEAAHYPGGEETRTAEDIKGMKAASSNCVPHADLSVFEVPTSVDFEVATIP